MSFGKPTKPNNFLLRLKRLLLVSASMCLCSAVFSQTTFISGIVNSYYRVIDVVPAKACFRVSNPSGLAHNDKVMAIQMKGASINTLTGSSFGDTSSVNNAGNYEIGTVCDIRGDSVFLVYQLLNQYTVSGKVQLVKIPQYYSATVTATLRAMPWDNANGIGGVLAIMVQEDLTLNANISVDSSGFRGGAYHGSSTGCANFPGSNLYAYNGSASPNPDGGYKGESIAELAISVSGGRGAAANGGGGGNNHNNGGAGGANLSPGGKGGGNSSATGCYRSYPGEAGKALSSYTGKKIFFGGGGGAGHVNNAAANARGGGHAGGIVFIDTKNLIGNGFTISSNGQTGSNAASDGASGGGAGGTIILDTDNYIGTTNINANGGAGGTEDDGINIERCYGSGGGGSGGAIYFSGTKPASNVFVEGGDAGVEFNRDPNCEAMVPSAGGLDGQTIENYSYRRSFVLVNGYCAILLKVQLIYFTARYAAGKTEIKWKADDAPINSIYQLQRQTNGNDWQTIHESGFKMSAYTDASPVKGYNLYRLKIIAADEKTAYSNIQKIYVPQSIGLINIFPNPAVNSISLSGDLSEIHEITILDLSGKLIFRKAINNSQGIVELKLPSLMSGLYLLKTGDKVHRLSILHH